MSEKKMQLADLHVQSFVTKLDGTEEETVKGGTFISAHFTMCGVGQTCDNSFIWRCTGPYCPVIQPGQTPAAGGVPDRR